VYAAIVIYMGIIIASTLKLKDNQGQLLNNIWGRIAYSNIFRHTINVYKMLNYTD